MIPGSWTRWSEGRKDGKMERWKDGKMERWKDVEKSAPVVSDYRLSEAWYEYGTSMASV